MPVSKPTKVALLAVALVAAGAAAVSVARKPAAGTTHSGLDPDYKFGEVVQGTPVEHSFSIQNRSGEPLRIKRLGTSYGVTVVHVDSVVPAGGTGRIQLRAETNGRRGALSEFANVYAAADSARPFARLRLIGDIVLPLQLSPQDRVYFFTTKGAVEHREITVTNHLGKPLRIISVASNNPVFSVRQQAVEPGKRYKLTVSLDPNAPVGRHEGSITVATDQPEYATVPIPALAMIDDIVSTTPKRVSFASILFDAADQPVIGQKEVLVKRQGGADFKVLRAATDVPFITVDVKPGREANTFLVGVRIEKKHAKRGTFSGTLTIETNDPAFRQLKLPITGNLV
jgi:Protein of unknown function (DUF1573)